MNEAVCHACLLKEQLRGLWDNHRNYFEVRKYLHDWTQQATSGAVSSTMRFAKYVAAHRRGSLNRFLFRISSGPLEGLNNKIEVRQRNAYRYRQRAYLTLWTLFINEAKHTFVG